MFEMQGFDKDASLGYIKDITKMVDAMLDGSKEKGLLSWHSGIPEEEVWIKIGGDHGVNSLKLTLQIVNTEHPNSKRNTIVIAMAQVRDTHTNLERLFENMHLQEQILALQDHKWQGKSMKIFLNGDYEFLTKVYALSGASGTFPCPWCLVPRQDIQLDPSQNQHASRTLTTLTEDFGEFTTKYGQDKKHAPNCHNSIHKPLLNIALDHVAPPYLHILLGIVKKHHDLLEIAAHELDKSLTETPDCQLTQQGALVKKFGGAWKTKVELEEKFTSQKSREILSGTPDQKMAYSREVEATEQQLENLQYKPLDIRDGPIASSLESVLEKHRITPQSYFSRAFVGNHCNKYLQSHVFTDLTDNIIKQTQACTNNPAALAKAKHTKKVFDSLNRAFASLHSEISDIKHICKTDIPAIQNQINTYMTLFRQLFPGKTIPKQHILETHIIPFIKTTPFGLGLLGEQGTEMCHQTIKILEKRAEGIKNKLKKMKFIMNSQLLQVNPDLKAISTD